MNQIKSIFANCIHKIFSARIFHEIQGNYNGWLHAVYLSTECLRLCKRIDCKYPSTTRLRKRARNNRERCFHGGNCEECRLVVCDAVLLLQEPTFRRNASYPTSGWKVTANVSSSRILTTLMTEAIHSTETSVLTKVARCHVPEDGIVHRHLRLPHPSPIPPLRLITCRACT
jgi:hypothetical protein